MKFLQQNPDRGRYLRRRQIGGDRAMWHPVTWLIVLVGAARCLVEALLESLMQCDELIGRRWRQKDDAFKHRKQANMAKGERKLMRLASNSLYNRDEWFWSGVRKDCQTQVRAKAKVFRDGRDAMRGKCSLELAQRLFRRRVKVNFHRTAHTRLPFSHVSELAETLHLPNRYQHYYNPMQPPE